MNVYHAVFVELVISAAVLVFGGFGLYAIVSHWHLWADPSWRVDAVHYTIIGGAAVLIAVALIALGVGLWRDQ